MGIWGDDGYKADGYCFGLNAIRHLSDDGEEVLEGWLYMHDSVRISGREGVEGHVARLKVSKRTSTMPAETTTPAAALGAFVDDVYLHLTVSLQLSPHSFSRLKAEMSGTSALALDARFKGEEYRAIRIEPDKEFASVELVNVRFTFFEESIGFEDTARRSLSRHLSSSLSSESLGSTSSQLAVMSTEMCEQAARTANLCSVDIETLAYSSVGILRKARSAFLAYTSLDDGDYHILSMRPREFTENVAALEDSKRQKLQARYTTLWKHFSINDVVTRGQAKAGAQAEGMTYEVEELEALARLNNEPLATWLVTTGATAARWVRNAVGAAKSIEVVRAELLIKMVQAHETLRRWDFHSGMASSEMKAAAALGAVFSPWVFHLIDEREKSAHLGEFA